MGRRASRSEGETWPPSWATAPGQRGHPTVPSLLRFLPQEGCSPLPSCVRLLALSNGCGDGAWCVCVCAHTCVCRQVWHHVLLRREPLPYPHLPVDGGCVALPLPASVSLPVHGGVGKLRVGPEVFSLESRMSGERGRLDEWEVDG